ncbi:MAG: hypothetical protein AAGE85_16250 [Pseudomonadota bacterium]
MRLPTALIVLDMLGMLLLGAGLYGLFGSNTTIDLETHAELLIVAGAVLMCPLLVYAVKRAASKRR